MRCPWRGPRALAAAIGAGLVALAAATASPAAAAAATPPTAGAAASNGAAPSAGALLRLSGSVTLQRGDLARGYEVRLVPADGSETRTAFVSTNGKYRFDGVRPATYTLRVVRSGTAWQGPGPRVALGGRRERIDLLVLDSGRTMLAARRSR